MKIRTIIILITSFLILFIGIVYYYSTKVNSFEECKNSLIYRGMEYYTLFVESPGATLQKCVLWTGKSFDE